MGDFPIHDVDIDKRFERISAFWERQNFDKPLVCAYGQKKDFIPKEIRVPDTLVGRWTDIPYLLERTKEDIRGTYYGGVALPAAIPNLGPDIFGTLFGCDIAFGEETSWAIPEIKSWDNCRDLSKPRESFWWDIVMDITEAYVKDGKEHGYIVGITDMHPGLDGLTSIRGPEELCMDLYDCPDEVIKRTEQMFRAYERTMKELYALTTTNQKYNTHWMNIIHDKPWYNISCDFMCMVSEEMFDTFVLPEIIRELRLFDKTIFHLDGPGALVHLDKLLEIPKLTGIQWVYGAGATTAKDWIPVLKKIQAAKKCIHVEAFPQDVQVLLENLAPEGLMMNCYCATEDEARAIEHQIDTFYKRGIF